MVKIVNFMFLTIVKKKLIMTIPSADKDMEQLELSDPAGRNAKPWKTVWQLLIKLNMYLIYDPQINSYIFSLKK